MNQKKINSKEIKIEELYEQKGKIITQMEILQNQLKNVNIKISELLRNEVKDGSTNGNGNS